MGCVFGQAQRAWSGSLLWLGWLKSLSNATPHTYIDTYKLWLYPYLLCFRLFTPYNYGQMRPDDRFDREIVWSYGVDLPCRINIQTLQAQGKSYSCYKK